MKFVLLVLVALGLTMAWQAAVVADNNQQQTALNVASHPADAAGTPRPRQD
jgi:hypothetical protein